MPDRHVYLAVGENLEVVADDADHREIGSVQQDRFAQHIRRPAEFPLPESFSQHDHRRSAQAVLIGAEEPAHHRIFTEHLEEICGHLPHRHSLGLAHSRQVVIVFAIASHRLDGAILLLPILKAEVRN